MNSSRRAKASDPTPAPVVPKLPPQQHPRVTGTRYTPPPGPDIQLIFPEAVPRVRVINKLEEVEPNPNIPAVPEEIPPSYVWSPRHMFYNSIPGEKGKWEFPPVDAMTLYLTATMARFSYGYTGENGDTARLGIAAALGGAKYARLGSPTLPLIHFDSWYLKSGLQIFAFPGTAALEQWVSYVVPTLVSVPYLPADWHLYNGIAQIATAYHAITADPTTGFPSGGAPIVCLGHSLGGALAQILGGSWARAFNIANPDGRTPTPLRSFYSFGAPAWLGNDLTTDDKNVLNIGVRCYLTGDPIPNATQFNMAAALSLLPAFDQLIPGFKRAVPSTQHYAFHTYQLQPPNLSQYLRLRTTMIQSLAAGGDYFLKVLIDQHAVRSYMLSTRNEALKKADTNTAEWFALEQANLAMDNVDFAGVPLLLGF